MSSGLFGKIRVLAGPDRGRELEFAAAQKVVMGRHPRSDLQLTDSEVSRLHCEINYEDDSFWITDLNSRNGTRVGGKRAGKAKLTDGVGIEIGVTNIEFTAHVRRPDLSASRFHVPSVAKRDRPAAAGTQADPDAAAGPAKPDAFEGKAIGEFKLVTRLGGGDSTHVYKAIQFSKNRLVALKILPPEVAADKTIMKRFIRGAKSGSQLRHPNIVRVLGGGLSDGVYYVWMEYVDGQNLKTALANSGPQGCLQVADALNIAVQISEALVLAYEKRIVHRNIKPGNILIGKDGVAKLADLGLAKTIEESGASDITDPGTILGTLNYMSPEQIQDAGVVDHRSDIYSLGATLYTMVTGAVPFAAPTTLDIMIQIQQKDVDPPEKHNASVPSNVSQIILKAMAKNPDERYQTPAEMLADMKIARHSIQK